MIVHEYNLIEVLKFSVMLRNKWQINVICLLQVVTNSGDEIANRAIELLKEVNTNLGPRLQSSILEFHESYISECLDRLRAHYDTVTVLSHDEGGIKEDGGLIGSPATINKLTGEAVKMCRVMKVLQEYIGECDGDFTVERKILPLHRYI